MMEYTSMSSTLWYVHRQKHVESHIYLRRNYYNDVASKAIRSNKAYYVQYRYNMQYYRVLYT